MAASASAEAARVREVPADTGQVRRGLAVGIASVALAVVALPLVARVPFGLLAVSGGMAWGLFCALRAASAKLHVAPGDGWLLALGSFLPLPFLVRFLAAQSGVLLPAPLRATWLLEVAALGAALGLLAALHRARRAAGGGPRAAVLAVAAVGAGLSGLLLLLATAASAPPRPGALTIWGATGALVAAALVVQWAVARRFRGTRLERFGSAAALLLAATQLLDGIVSYLSVEDPLGVLTVDFAEQVPLSAWLLETTGPGYAAAKWLVALSVVYFVDGKPWPARPEPTGRLGFYLFVALLGLGPGLFSASRLLV